ncbi:hypothetical protein D0T84_08695 [Dysgonomonas sp. 521]|uniref:LPP20 family lipoprotein n=1 Tax=Dysgonomonas sp. 521 TaxID=2302932 RepID=UPI0013D311FB|nr:LPP20 family lipoprotein [Dysgonomonas sp. 521]NDV94993.1 hypothetical protein [Dysgonomonas sp. 521]
MRLLSISVLLLCICFPFALSAKDKKPEWVKQRPVDRMSYIGIGVAPKSAPDYMLVAKKNALNDLASEIKVEVESESLLQTVEKNEQVSSFLSNNIQVRAQQDMEQFEMTASWEDDKQYWVYYKLSKLDYEEYMHKRKLKATNEGYYYWTKGNEALSQRELFSAVELYSKGIMAVQPCANDELKQEHEGKTIDVALELYNSINRVFDNITVTSSPSQLLLQSFDASSTPVMISVMKDGTPLKNLKLKIGFISGSGSLSSNDITNDQGEVALYIQNITSKAARQEIKAAIDMSRFTVFNDNILIENVLSKFRATIPQCVISIEVVPVEIKAFIKNTGKANDALTKSVRNMLSNDYFSVVNDAEQADILILVSSNIKKGGKVKGEMYNMIEYFSTVEIEIVDVRTSQTLYSTNVNDFRSLSPESTSETKAESTALREVMRKLEKDFKKGIKNLNINKNSTE